MKKFVLFCFAFLCFLSMSAAEKHTLRVNLKKGDTFTQTIDMQTSLKMKFSGVSMDIDMPMVMDLKFKVNDVFRDSLNLVTEIQRIKFQTEVMGKVLRIDTDMSNSTSEEFLFLRKFIGKPFTMTVDKRWNVLGIRDFDGILESVLDGNSKEEVEEAEAAIASMISKERLSGNFAESMVVFPEEPVSVGYVWSKDDEVSVSGISMKIKTTNTVKSIDSKSGEVVIASESLVDMQEVSVEGMQMSLSKESKISGEYTYFIKTGRLKSSNLQMSIPMNMSVQEKGQAQSISMHLTADIKSSTR